MVDGIHRGDDREKHLGSADVARGFVSADMLLASLESEPISGSTMGVFTHSNQSSWHQALQRIPDRHVGGVGSTETERHAQTLSGADGDVGTEFTGRAQECEGKNIGGDNRQSADRVSAFNDRGVVEDGAGGVWVLENHGERDGGEVEIRFVADEDSDPERFGSSLEHGNGLRVAKMTDKDRAYR